MSFNGLYAIFAALLLTFSASGLGLGLLNTTGSCRSLRSSGILLLAFGLGTGLLSLLTLFAGLAGILYPPVMLLLLGCGFIFGGKRLFLLIGHSIHEFRESSGYLGYFNICLFLIAALLIFNGLAALAPPLDVDVLHYHLAAPHIYIMQHRILPVPGIYHSYFPFSVQMLYTLCLGLGSVQAAQWMHVIFGLANIMAIAVIGRQFYDRKTAVLAALLFYALPDVGGETALARVDLGVSFYALLAFWGTTAAQTREQERQWLLLCSGILAGLCGGSKYTGLIVPGLIIINVLLFQPVAWRKRVQLSLIAGLAAFTVAMPWYARNLFWTGNPVFPFLTELFGQGALSDQYLALIRQGNWGYAAVPRTVKNLLLTPWLLLVRRDLFASNRIGPLFLAYLPLFWGLRWSRLKPLRPLVIFCLVWFPFWFWTSPVVRFFFAPFGLLCILLAHTLRLVIRYHPFWRRLSLTFLCLWLTFTVVWNIKNHLTLVPVAIGRISAEKFLDETQQIEQYRYADFEFVNKVLRPQKLLLFGSHGFYVRMPFVLASDWALEHWQEVDACEEERLTSALRTSGVTHIMFSDAFSGRGPAENGLYQCYQHLYAPVSQQYLLYSAGITRILNRDALFESIRQKEE